MVRTAMRQRLLILSLVLAACGRPPPTPSDPKTTTPALAPIVLGWPGDEISLEYVCRVLEHHGLEYAVVSRLAWEVRVGHTHKNRALDLLRGSLLPSSVLITGESDDEKARRSRKHEALSRTGALKRGGQLDSMLRRVRPESEIARILKELPNTASWPSEASQPERVQIITATWTVRPFITTGLKPTEAIDAHVQLQLNHRRRSLQVHVMP